MVWLLRLSHLMPGDHFLSGNLNNKVLLLVILGISFGHIGHELTDVWPIIWLWRDRTCRTWEDICSINVSFALKSGVDMLKMWVHKRTRAESKPTNHYQSKS